MLTITVSGPQGSGKTTVADYLRSLLNHRGGKIAVPSDMPSINVVDQGNVGGHDYGREDLGSGALAARVAEETAAPLTLDAYQARTADTAIYPGKGTPLGLIYCALKMNGEAGELAEHVGKAIRDDGYAGPHEVRFTGQTESTEVPAAPLTDDRRDVLKKELGDVLWYVASAARELGFDLGEIAQANLDKLAGRKARGTLGGSGDHR